MVLATLIRDQPLWHELLPSIAFAINSTYSRVLGTTPFEVIHGHLPRLPLHSQLQGALFRRREEEEEGLEPISVAQRLVSMTVVLVERVREIQRKAFEAARAKFIAHAHGKSDFAAGDLVLVRYPQQDKLDVPWRGPFQVVSKEPHLTYMVKLFGTEEAQRVHVNRMHVFYPGKWSDEELKAEAVPTQEYYIEQVYSHELVPGRGLRFHVKWLGYPEYPLDEPDAWSWLEDCRHTPQVKAYMKTHHL